LQALGLDAAETDRVMRSLLFVPGDSDKKLSKALDLGADGVVLDLEDSVAAKRKDLARHMTRDYLLDAARGRTQLWVRINPLETGDVLHDLATVVAAAPDGIMLPKADSPLDVERVSNFIDVLEVEHGLEIGSVGIIPVATETPAAVFNIGDYQFGSPRIKALTWGAEDLSAAIGASNNVDESGRWLPPHQVTRALCLFAAYAGGVQAMDTVMADFRDEDRLKRVCDEARRDGFTGKLAIHPTQVAVINAAFSPSSEELAHARAVVDAFAAAPDAGTLSLDGKMLDRPHLTQAERIIALAGLVQR
jgi:citrate lyase subunit beta / citryl-CoA lyase